MTVLEAQLPPIIRRRKLINRLESLPEIVIHKENFVCFLVAFN